LAFVGKIPAQSVNAARFRRRTCPKCGARPLSCALRPMVTGVLQGKRVRPGLLRPRLTLDPSDHARGQTPDVAGTTSLRSVRTALCDLLGIEVPIVQAPIGAASVPALAAAVSEAGALGTIALSWTKPGDVGAVVREVRALTDRPFHANILLEWPPEERLDA